MNIVRSVRRFLSNIWLAATPLVIIVAIIGFFIILGIVKAIIVRVHDPDVAENFLIDAMFLASAVVVLLPVGFAVYGLGCIVRWLLSKNKR